MRILVTGSTGFIGQYAVPYLKKSFQINTVSLKEKKVNEIDFSGIDAVLHLAGKAHQMQDVNSEEYYKINYHLTVELADKAKKNGVGQFIFISTVKVYGDELKDELNEELLSLQERYK